MTALNTSAAIARSTTPPSAMGVSVAGFRKFAASKRGKKATSPRVDEEIILPTAERMTQADKPARTKAGHYRSVGTVERLRNEGKLDPAPHINEGMFLAAEKLMGHYRQAGLGGIKGIDTTRFLAGYGSGVGTGDACGMPQNGVAYHHRQKFLQATTLMGWHIEAPFRGAGRITVAVVCEEMNVKDAAAIHMKEGRAETQLAAAMDRLREGLFILATHWGLFSTKAQRIRYSHDDLTEGFER